MTYAERNLRNAFGERPRFRPSKFLRTGRLARRIWRFARWEPALAAVRAERTAELRMRARAGGAR